MLVDLIGKLEFISIHAAQEGCDKFMPFTLHGFFNFNPRSPRGLRLNTEALRTAATSISIHAAQEGCDFSLRLLHQNGFSISIHAAQEGCDGIKPDVVQYAIISIHAAQEGCDQKSCCQNAQC